MPITLADDYTDKTTQVIEDGQRIGYVEDSKLYGLAPSGYFEPICEINHRSEIIGKLKAWREKQNPELDLCEDEGCPQHGIKHVCINSKEKLL